MSEQSKKTKDEQSEDDFWDDSNRPSFEYFSFEEVGDKVRGYYVGKRISTNPYSEKKQEDYILDTPDGYKMVAGRAPLKAKDGLQVIYDMLDIPLGADVGLIFDHEKETKKGTAKIIEARYSGEKDESKVDEFQEKFDLGDNDDYVEGVEAEGEQAPQEEEEEMPEF